MSFALSPDATAIAATAGTGQFGPSTVHELHRFALEGGAVHHVTRIGIDPGSGEIDQPFAPPSSPDGSLLFVQATSARHFAVHEVDGMKFGRKPSVLPAGEGPASMALSPRQAR